MKHNSFVFNQEMLNYILHTILGMRGEVYITGKRNICVTYTIVCHMTNLVFICRGDESDVVTLEAVVAEL